MHAACVPNHSTGGVPCTCAHALTWCVPTNTQSLGHYLAAFPAPGHTAEEGGHTDWEGADYAIGDVCDTLRLMREQRSLLKRAPVASVPLSPSIPLLQLLLKVRVNRPACSTIPRGPTQQQACVRVTDSKRLACSWCNQAPELHAGRPAWSVPVKYGVACTAAGMHRACGHLHCMPCQRMLAATG
jgi:hypothetical protein